MRDGSFPSEVKVTLFCIQENNHGGVERKREQGDGEI